MRRGVVAILLCIVTGCGSFQMYAGDVPLNVPAEQAVAVEMEWILVIVAVTAAALGVAFYRD